jgi:hypothetical protein
MMMVMIIMMNMVLKELDSSQGNVQNARRATFSWPTLYKLIRWWSWNTCLNNYLSSQLSAAVVCVCEIAN